MPTACLAGQSPWQLPRAPSCRASCRPCTQEGVDVRQRGPERRASGFALTGL